MPAILMTFWREIAIGILILTVATLWEFLDRRSKELIEVKARWQEQIAEAKRVRLEMEQRSDEALIRLADEHKANLEKVEKNAWINFKTRYGDLSRLCPVRLPSQSGGQLGQAGTADSSRAPDDPGQEPMAAFVADCAADAAQVAEFQRWVRLSQFPISDR